MEGRESRDREAESALLGVGVVDKINRTTKARLRSATFIILVLIILVLMLLYICVFVILRFYFYFLLKLISVLDYKEVYSHPVAYYLLVILCKK